MNTLKIKTRWIPGLMNIIGLGLAFSVFLVLMGQVWYDYSYDRFLQKEIAIRKINGAKKKNIMSRICRRYLLIVAAGFLIAVPATIAICMRWLQHFAFRTDMPVWLFVLSLAIVTIITLASVITQTWIAASANPVETLKNE